MNSTRTRICCLLRPSSSTRPTLWIIPSLCIRKFTRPRLSLTVFSFSFSSFFLYSHHFLSFSFRIHKEASGCHWSSASVDGRVQGCRGSLPGPWGSGKTASGQAAQFQLPQGELWRKPPSDLCCRKDPILGSHELLFFCSVSISFLFFSFLFLFFRFLFLPLPLWSS